MSTFWTSAAMLAGTTTQVVGQLQQGAAALNAGRYNAAVARQNAEAKRQASLVEAQQLDYAAQIAQEDASLAEAAGAFAERQSRLVTARRQGENEAIIGASGVTTAGSPLAVLLENVYQGEQEAELLRYRGSLEALAHRREAQQFGYQAQVRRGTGERSLISGEQSAGIAMFQGRSAQLGATSAALGTLAGGIGRYYARKTPV